MSLWKISAGEVKKRPGRAFLTLLSIVIGVATVVSVSFAMSTTRSAYSKMYEAITGRAALEITAEGGGNYDEGLIEEVRKIPGVQTAVPLLQRQLIIELEGERIKMLTLGIDPKLDRAVRDYELEAGEFFVERGEESLGVLLDAAFVRNMGGDVNSPVMLLTRRGRTKTRLAGLLKATGVSAAAQGPVLLMPIKAAQHRFNAEGRLDNIQIVLANGVNEETVRGEIAKILPAGLNVNPPALRSQFAEETMKAIEQGLTMAREFSTVAAVFIIINTFLMSVSERRKPLSIMRAIGATRGQVAGMLFREAVVLGVVGTLIGATIGWIGANVLNVYMGRLFQANLPPLEFRIMPFIWGAVFGLTMSLIGVAIPARKTWKLSPLEGMRGSVRDVTAESSSWLRIAGVGVLGLSGVGLLLVTLGLIPVWASVLSALVGLIGIVMLLPLGVPILSSVAAGILQPIIRVEAQLARKQLLRNRGRTTLTIGVLFVAFTTGIALANAIIDNVDDVKQWYRQSLVGDYFIRATMPDMSTGVAADMPDGVDEELRKIPGIKTIDTLRFARVSIGEHDAVIMVRQYTSDNEINFDIFGGYKPSELRKKLYDGQIILGSVLAQRMKKKAGDTITLETREGKHDFRVAEVANEYTAGGLALHMQRDVARRWLGIDGVDAYIVKANPGDRPAVSEALKALCSRESLMYQPYVDLITLIDSMMGGLVASLWVLLVLGFIVAAFGMVNTLTMNVLEQTRELGLLRTVGMTRRQVRRTILAQATMMAMMGILPALVTGIGLAWLINVSTHPVTGHHVEFVLRPGFVLGALGAAFVLVILAALIPAERAARLQLAMSLRYE